MSPGTFSGKWARKFATNFHTCLSFIVFLWLDFVEVILCVIFRYLDKFFEGKASACQCLRSNYGIRNEENEVSETLHGRKNIFREMGFLRFPRKWDDSKKTGIVDHEVMKNSHRWSDCGCESCVSWMNNCVQDDEQKLHVQIKEPLQEGIEGSRESTAAIENVIFLHGFLSSSSFWTETVFPNLSDHQRNNYRLFAVDLLGFGRSPKPRDKLYTLRDHFEMIEKSVISQFDLKSFHLVAHSMGCIIALALAAKHPSIVRSITLVAPPCFPDSRDGAASLAVLKRVAEKRLWPLPTFGTAIMSWYEHLGRCLCFFICRHHRTWEKILKLLTQRRELHFLIMDLTKHTHQSAWHSMHNVICGAAGHIDGYLERLVKSGVKVCAIHGDRDQTAPVECSHYIKTKVPDADINIISKAGHKTVIFRRTKEFTRSLERVWASSAERL
ncbi:hypothetical protein AB3S75_035197 [Citrus x aurantiifolia]